MNKKIFLAYQEKYATELNNDCIKFWLANGIDRENGGVYTYLTREGKVYSRDKSVWLNGRCLWTFSTLSLLYGKKPQWREAADLCKSFLDAHCIDPTDGRMYFSVTNKGKPLRKRRYMFSETFYIIGSATYGNAFGDKKAIETARRYFDMILSIYRDSSSDPSHPAPKTYPEQRPMRAFAETMILLNVSHIMRQCDPDRLDVYDTVAKALTDDIFKYFYREDLKIVLEIVGPNGEFYSDTPQGRFINPGHIMESVWFLLVQMENSGDKTLLSKIESMFQWSLNIGWDEKYEGMVYFRDALGYTPEALEHDMKVWWVTCEMIIASLRLYEVTRKQYYWDWFIRLDKYATKFFRDPEYGEWFGYLHYDNTPTEPICKGNMFKGPFHVPRMLFTAERCLDRLAREK